MNLEDKINLLEFLALVTIEEYQKPHKTTTLYNLLPQKYRAILTLQDIRQYQIKVAKHKTVSNGK
jgi:hypothetical protein